MASRSIWRMSTPGRMSFLPLRRRLGIASCHQPPWLHATRSAGRPSGAQGSRYFATHASTVGHVDLGDLAYALQDAQDDAGGLSHGGGLAGAQGASRITEYFRFLGCEQRCSTALN